MLRSRSSRDGIYRNVNACPTILRDGFSGVAPVTNVFQKPFFARTVVNVAVLGLVSSSQVRSEIG